MKMLTNDFDEIFFTYRRKTDERKCLSQFRTQILGRRFDSSTGAFCPFKNLKLMKFFVPIFCRNVQMQTGHLNTYILVNQKNSSSKERHFCKAVSRLSRSDIII